jgi:hypothetical protein
VKAVRMLVRNEFKKNMYVTGDENIFALRDKFYFVILVRSKGLAIISFLELKGYIVVI